MFSKSPSDNGIIIIKVFLEFWIRKKNARVARLDDAFTNVMFNSTDSS